MGGRCITMKVFIAGPYTLGDVAVNVRNACFCAEEVRRRGHLPFVPHLFHLWHLISPHEYEYWTAMDDEWLRESDAILRLPGRSPGADREIELARRLGIPIVFSLEELAEVQPRLI